MTKLAPKCRRVSPGLRWTECISRAKRQQAQKSTVRAWVWIAASYPVWIAGFRAKSGQVEHVATSGAPQHPMESRGA